MGIFSVLLGALSTGAVGCDGGDDQVITSVRLVEGEAYIAKDTVVLVSSEYTIRAESVQMVQVRAWTIGLMYGAEATLSDPAGDVIWKGSSLGAELRIDGVRLDSPGDYSLEVTWLEGKGIAGYRYTVLSQGKAQVTSTEIGSLGQPRMGHSVTLLPNGMLLVAGGFESGTMLQYGEVSPLSSVELIDPATGRSEVGTELAQPRAWHLAWLIPPDTGELAGKVVFFGGIGPKGDALSSTEVYDPATGKFTAGPFIPEPRAFLDGVWVSGTGAFLDNKLLLIGGERTRVGPQHSKELGLYKEIDENPLGTYSFDPSAATIQPLANLTRGRIHPAVVLLDDGRVLVIGGGVDTLPSARGCDEANEVATCHCTSDDVKLCTQFDPCVDGEVCGYTSFIRKDRGTRSVEVYDPNLGGTSFTVSPSMDMAHSRVGHSASLIPGGLVVVAGGASALRRSFVPTEAGLAEWPRTTDSVELFDPSTNKFRPLPPLAIPREQHVVASLADGRLVLMGGFEPRPGGLAPVSLIEVLDPDTRRFTATSNLQVARGAFEVVRLHDGQTIVVVGGEDADGAVRALETVASEGK